MAAVSFIVLRHQYGRRDVMFKYLAPARERDFKYLLFDTPFPQVKPALNHSLFFKRAFMWLPTGPPGLVIIQQSQKF